MDFFSAANGSASIGQTEHNSFAQAITAGFGTFTARLPATMPTPRPVKKSSPTTASLAAPTASLNFTAVQPGELPTIVNVPSVLFIDIRPHAAFTNARLPNALSLSVPSTLLKRPLFSLERLASMLPSPQSRTRFLQWDQCTQIIVYDADSSTLPDSSNILGLLKKFFLEKPAFSGKLCWLKGGFQGVWRDRKEFIDSSPVMPDINSQAPSNSLQTSLLPKSAFHMPKRSSPAAGALRPSMSISHQQQAYNPFFDTVRQNIELSHGITERIPLKLPQRVKQRIDELPFQWLRDIARRSTSLQETDVEESMEALAMQFYRIELAEQRRLMGVMEHHSKESLLPSSLTEFSKARPFPFSITAGVEKGAKNRYRHIWPFEHARVRLHSNATPPLSSPRPHSPSLTVPFVSSLPESTPVFATALPLGNPPSSGNDEDDYVNASYVQPLCTRRRYIATQGPLDATFVDFWTLVWQQNVHVIVMLTREVEGSTVKCGKYWRAGSYGGLRLQLVSTEGEEDLGDSIAKTGFFNSDSEASAKHTSTIKRTFILTHTGFPKATPRRITHFQYLGWPDMNVPDDPRGILNLMKEVSVAVDESQARESAICPPKSPPSGHLEAKDLQIDPVTNVAKHQGTGVQPLLLHCSAGVGRTGGFIAVDAALDGIRTEIRKSRQSSWVATRDLDGDIIMDDAGRRMVPIQPNKEGNVLHIPAVVTDQPLPLPPRPSTQIWAESVGASDLTMTQLGAPPRAPAFDCTEGTMKWTQQLSQEPAPLAGVAVSPRASSRTRRRWNEAHDSTEERSSLDTTTGSSSDNSSSDDSSLFGFPRTRSADEPSPFGVGSAYTTSSSNTTNSTSELIPGVEAKKPMHLSLDSGGAGGIRGVMAQRLVEDIHSTYTVSSPERPGSTAPPPPASRSLSPSRESMTDHSSHSISQPLAHIGHPLLRAPQPVIPLESKPSNSPSPPANYTNVDYKEPRAMHADVSPPLLSSYDTPLCELVQDMREQRMSLCQSLRQYVFVHAAVIEGALMVLDEENEKAGAFQRPPSERTTSSSSRASLAASPGHPGPTSSMIQPTFTFSDHGSTSSSGKRRASPTELPHENIKGEEKLIKRPSIKRKHRSHDESMSPHGVKKSNSDEHLGPYVVER